jgi:hypothetical protein
LLDNWFGLVLAPVLELCFEKECPVQMYTDSLNLHWVFMSQSDAKSLVRCTSALGCGHMVTFGRLDLERKRDQWLDARHGAEREVPACHGDSDGRALQYWTRIAE